METQTLLVDGEDARELYGLDAAFRPYELGGKLIFVGERGLRRFVVYDGQRLGPTFDGIAVAHCCEGTLTSVQLGSGRYVFWAWQEGGGFVVEITEEGELGSRE